MHVTWECDPRRYIQASLSAKGSEQIKKELGLCLFFTHPMLVDGGFNFFFYFLLLLTGL